MKNCNVSDEDLIRSFIQAAAVSAVTSDLNERALSEGCSLEDIEKEDHVFKYSPTVATAEFNKPGMIAIKVAVKNQPSLRRTYITTYEILWEEMREIAEQNGDEEGKRTVVAAVRYLQDKQDYEEALRSLYADAK